MRNYTRGLFIFPKTGLLIICLFAFAAITACKKDEDTTPKFSNLRFVHAIPDVASMDLHIDENTTAQNIAYGDASTYVQVPAGKHLVTTTGVGSIAKKVNTSHVFDADKYFSVIGYGSNAKPESLLVPDTTGAPAAGKVWIRYVNLSPVATGYQYVLKRTDSPGFFDFGNRNFRTASNYIEFDANAYTFNAYNREAGSNPPVAASTGLLNFEGGKIYTLVLIGTQTGTAPFDLKLLSFINK